MRLCARLRRWPSMAPSSRGGPTAEARFRTPPPEPGTPPLPGASITASRWPPPSPSPPSTSSASPSSSPFSVPRPTGDCASGLQARRRATRAPHRSTPLLHRVRRRGVAETKRLATSRPRRIRHEIGQPMCSSAPTGPTPLTTVGSSPGNRHRLGESGGCLRYPLGSDTIEVL